MTCSFCFHLFLITGAIIDGENERKCFEETAVVKNDFTC